VTKEAQKHLNKSKEGDSDISAVPVGSQRVDSYNLDLEESSEEEEEMEAMRFELCLDCGFCWVVSIYLDCVFVVIVISWFDFFYLSWLWLCLIVSICLDGCFV
jgi:hypothetical protein